MTKKDTTQLKSQFKLGNSFFCKICLATGQSCDLFGTFFEILEHFFAEHLHSDFRCHLCKKTGYSKVKNLISHLTGKPHKMPYKTDQERETLKAAINSFCDYDKTYKILIQNGIDYKKVITG